MILNSVLGNVFLFFLIFGLVSTLSHPPCQPPSVRASPRLKKNVEQNEHNGMVLVLPFPPATPSPPPSPPRARVPPRIDGMVSLAPLDELNPSNLGSTSYCVECKAR